jgi:maltose-binding protein MalE
MRHAWNFLKDITSESSSKSYNEMTNRAPARIALLDESEKDPNFGVFAKQVRYAKSIKNFDRDKYNDIFDDAIIETIDQGKSPSKALQDASERINAIVSVYQ